MSKLYRARRDALSRPATCRAWPLRPRLDPALPVLNPMFRKDASILLSTQRSDIRLYTHRTGTTHRTRTYRGSAECARNSYPISLLYLRTVRSNYSRVYDYDYEYEIDDEKS